MAGAFHKGDVPKCMRALELHEKGVDNDAIALRIGIHRRAVSQLIKEGKKRREQMCPEETAQKKWVSV